MPALTSWSPNRYPRARRSDHVDTYKSEKNGDVRIHDPYQWLEHDSTETKDWVTAQEQFTRQYLDLNPERQDLENQIRKNVNYAKFTAPSLKEDGRWYWYYNTGLQAQNVLYRSTDDNLPDFSKVDGAGGEVFFDPNLLSSDGTAALAVTRFSPSGEYFAYGISRSGSDFCTIYVRSTSSPLASSGGATPSHDDKRLPEEIRYVKFSSVDWTHDSKGFFYQRFPGREYHGSANDDIAGTETESDKNAMLYYHRLGTQQSEDVLVCQDASNPDWMWGAEVSEVDGRYLIVTVSRDTSRRILLWVADLKQDAIGQNLKWDKVINDFDAEYEYIANDGTLFYLKTNKDASQYKIVTVDIAQPPEKRVFKDLIPEDKGAFLKEIFAFNDNHAVVVYTRNVKDEMYIYELSTGKQLERLASDFVGAAYVSARRSQKWCFATLTGFTTPCTVAKYDFRVQDKEKRWDVLRSSLVGGLDLDDFLAEQVWYTSKDGTRVPMFIVRHKDTKFDGTAPALQYGYGGFQIVLSPSFSASILTWIKKYGAIYAVANIRGGSEFGKEWHSGGALENKANCFDDFVAAAQFLVDNKYAAPGKVAINGGSNGGLLVAACVNRAPEGLLGAAVADVGVLDLLKFADFTIGRAWTSDYGDPHNPHDFDFIYPISPLHNVPTNKELPPLMLTTADHDDRVVPLHSFKHAATVQHLHAHNPHPLLIRIDKKAGHGAGKSTEMRIKEWADKYGFIAQSLGLRARDS